MRFAALLLVGCMDPAPSPRVTVTGTVRDGMNEPVADVDVVFRGSRDATAKTGPDGTYQLQLLAGEYRAFVRGDSVLSVGRTDRSRLPGLPEAVAAGALDEALLPTITLAHDASGMDLEVMRAGVITGTVFDTEARPVMGVVVSAHGATELSPTTGTDITITRRDGTFELRVPHGDHRLAMTHPAFADTVDAGSLDVRGGTRHVSLTLAKGCVIAGKVVDARGRPARGGSNEASTEGMVEGSIERRLGLTDLDFAPVARSHADGTFRFTTVERGDIVLRAWPWHRPPSETKRFACKDGARFTTTFRIPERAPDLAGTLVDKHGKGIPFAHLDIQPLEPGAVAQQERTDVAGTWAVFQLPPGRYLVSAVTRAGVVSKVITSPALAERLELSGVGRLAGTATALVDGTFELALATCLDGTTLGLPREPRRVIVKGGQFVVDNLPACDLQLGITWRGETQLVRTKVPRDGTARIQLAIGEPRPKRVTGVVRDREGHAIAGARVTALAGKRVANASTDDDGRFAIDTFAGATISGERGRARGQVVVGLANVAAERVEIVAR